jgi:serine/threonine protein kinase
MRSRATTTTTRPGTSKGTHFIRPSTSAGAGSNATASHERGGTPKHTPGSTATSSTRHRNPPEKESKPQSISRRQSSVLGLRDRQPARDGTAQRHAKEVEGLKDYQLGHCLGRGAFGSVYSALNWSTGETVAIKQVRLSDMPKTELNVIMQEIDLLKNLNHPNIVKYHGFVKSSEALWIILEYCEQGSLYTICKNFGKFPENLVGLYIAQVLQGLLFLHDQGVIHRDIKGANILTTKEGLVKLADFGVATKQQGLAEGSVVGTPYWMAPEVIELAGATTASDIWSLGCTVIELLDGKPPYHKFAPMPALFRIVNDDHPPLPEGTSPLVRDFLMQCFQKDPNLRVSAKKLLKHPWIVSAKRADISTKGEKKMEYNEAVKHVQEWNEALKSSPPPTQSRNGNAQVRKPAARPLSRTSVTSGLERPGSRSSAENASDNARPPFRVASRKSSGNFPSRRKTGSMSDTNPFGEALTKQAVESLANIPGEQGQMKDNWDGDFEAMNAEFDALKLPTHRRPQDHFQGLFSSERLKQYANFDAIPENDSESRLEAWDEDFEGGDGELTVRSPLPLPSRPPHERNQSRDSQPRTQILKVDSKLHKEKLAASRIQSQTTASQLQLNKSTQIRSALAASTSSNRWVEEPEDEDYSDLVTDNADEDVFRRKLVGFSPNRPLVPSELANLQNKMAGSIRSRRRTHTPTQLVHDAAAMRRTRSSLEIQKYAESEDDEDFGQDLVFDERAQGREFSQVNQGKIRGSPSTKSSVESESGESALSEARNQQAPRGNALQLSNSLSWGGDDDDEDEDEEDPFAQLEEELDDVDLELNVARDKHARLCTLVESLVGAIKRDMPEDDLVMLLDQLLGILDDATESSGGGDIRNVIVSSHGMLPILEILEEAKRQDIILRLLRVVNRILDGSAEVQENLCFVGGIPVVTKFAGRKFATEIRLETAAFVRMMYTTPHSPGAALMMAASVWKDAAPLTAAPTMTLQMFVACGGLNVLVEFLEEDYDTPAGRELVLTGVNGIWSVFELQGSTPKNDFCRIFSRSAVLYPLSLVLNRVLDEEGDLARVVESRIVNIFLLFSQAENHVKETVADRMVLKRVLKDLRRMSPMCQITMLKFIKNLSMLATTLDALQNSNAIEVLTDFLGTAIEQQQSQHRRRPQPTSPSAGSTSNFREITNQLLNTMFNLCRLSKSRQEDAALSGLIPLLQRIVQTERPLKEFALPILCDMAHSGKVGRKILWQNKGLAFYVELLKEPYWAVTALDALFVWLQEETGKVEECLLTESYGSGGFAEAIVSCFVEAKADAFENLLEPLQKMLRLSPAIAASLSSSRAFFERAVGKVVVAKKALVRLNILRVVRSVVDAAVTLGFAQQQVERGSLGVGQLTRETGLLGTAQRLHTEDTAILVREMAGELMRSCEQCEVGNKRSGLGTRRSSNSLSANTPLSAISAGRGGTGYFDFQPSILGPSPSSLPGGTSSNNPRRQSMAPMLENHHHHHRSATVSSFTTAPTASLSYMTPPSNLDRLTRSPSRASDISETSSTTTTSSRGATFGLPFACPVEEASIDRSNDACHTSVTCACSSWSRHIRQ